MTIPQKRIQNVGALLVVILISLICQRNNANEIELTQIEELYQEKHPDQKKKKHRHRPQDYLCNGYAGILWISHVNTMRANAGNVFFESVINSLLYAEQHSLYPFVFLDENANSLPCCYDEPTHTDGPTRTYTHLGAEIPSVIGSKNMTCHTASGQRPSRPDMTQGRRQSFILKGNGMWTTYFHPISPNPMDAQFHKSPCYSMPVYQFTREQMSIDIPTCSEFAVRVGPVVGMPLELQRDPELSLQEWLWESRQRASAIVERYFRPLPWIQKQIDRSNLVQDMSCLALFIPFMEHHGYSERLNIVENLYLPYVDAYSQATNYLPIYVSTRDADVLPLLRDRVESQIIGQGHALRILNGTVAQNKQHRRNTETIVDIYGMAKCGFMVHGGASAVAEAAIYVQPVLGFGFRSVNVDDPDRPSPENFGTSVQQILVMEAQVKANPNLLVEIANKQDGNE